MFHSNETIEGIEQKITVVIRNSLITTVGGWLIFIGIEALLENMMAINVYTHTQGK